MTPIGMANMTNMWLKTLCVMSKVTGFVAQDGRPDRMTVKGRRTKTTDDADPSVSHMDQSVTVTEAVIIILFGVHVESHYIAV